MPESKKTPHSRPALAALLAGLVLFFAEDAMSIKVIAHRGNSSVCPENTLEAFRSAMALGVDYVELDSQVSKDNCFVVIHDNKLDRTTNSAQVFNRTDALVSQLKWSEMAGLDAGSWKGERFKGEKLPTLEESLQLIQKGNATLLERKSGSALQYARMLEKMGYDKSLVLQSFDWDFLAAVRSWSPQIRLGALCGEDPTPERLRELQGIGVKLAVWGNDKITESNCRLFKEHGLEWWVYTIDDPSRWDLFVNWKVDGIITNKPAELIEWLKSKGLR